jgi:hypothetical protein
MGTRGKGPVEHALLAEGDGATVCLRELGLDGGE